MAQAEGIFEISGSGCQGYLADFLRERSEHVERQIKVPEVIQVHADNSRKGLQGIVVQIKLGEVLVCEEELKLSRRV